ncbi:hypothetical protein [Halosimplex halophilum]|uniref:hypothetical protein n=1 Tax=Halosimplex halophilum TaxID=2559572 RepID=UPI00107EFB9D|nr:hypothetical protein [Halosimplex halophilum]
MKLRNREGEAVDPVPFLVVAGIAFAVVYSFGPLYFRALGLPIRYGVVVSTGLFAASTAGLYHRMVWTLDPAYREVVPVGDRFERLLLATLACIGAVVLLALPLVV